MIEDAHPTLAAVIPARRGSVKTLQRTLSSALAQGDELAEIIVVDDNGPGAPLREALGPALAERVRVVESMGLGAGGARNVGIRATAGDWIAFLDADDLWCEGYAARVRATIAEDPDAGACFSSAWHVNDAGAAVARFDVSIRRATMIGLLTRRLQATTSATAVNRAAALEVGGFYEDFERPAGVEDIDLWWRIASRRRCLVQPEPLVHYVFHERRDRRRSRAELDALSRDRARCIERIRGAVSYGTFRRAAAQHRAMMARYWFLAGYGRKGLDEAIRSLMWAPTFNGAAAIAMGFVPSRTRDVVRVWRRRLALARREASG